MKALTLVMDNAELWDIFGVVTAVSRYPYQKDNPVYREWLQNFQKYLGYNEYKSHCIVFEGFEIAHLHKCMNLYIRYRAGRSLRYDDIANHILKGGENYEQRS